MPGLFQKQYQDEDAAREHLEKLIWPNGPVCPHCSQTAVTKLVMKEGTDTHGRKGLYQCNTADCRKQFTVTVGTIFEDSHIPLHKWLLAFHLMCSSKKGISALQLQRNLELGSYRTAWFMCHRIRWAMTQTPMAEALMKGVVEVDETYVGGKERGVGSGRPGPDKSKKTPVLALVERGGNVRSFPLERATLNNIKPILKKHIDPSSQLVTDEFPVYYQMRKDFAGHHEIQHKAKKYVRKEGDLKVTTNTVESYFSLLKRSNYGIFHHWSRKYLGQYCAEVDFRYNGRKLSDDERTIKAIKGADGRRLMLKQPKNVD